MSILSPHIKHEEEDMYGSTMHDYSNQSNYNQTGWPSTNGHANMANARASISDFGSQSNLSSSFQGGGSTFNDDELGFSLDYDQTNQPQQSHVQHVNGSTHAYGNGGSMGQFGMSAPAQMNREHLNSFSFEGHHNGQYGSHFANGTAAQQRQYHPGPLNLAQLQQGPASNMAHVGMSYRPAASQAASNRMPFTPVSPQNPTITALQQLGTSDTSSHGSHPLPNHRHRSSSSSQWSQAFDLAASPNNDTPLTSPMSIPPLQHQFGSLTDQGKSVPSRTKSATQKAQSVPSPGVTKDEQKRAKRRHAHNVVEQKRRDKINERIQELSRLVPPHRLEDSKLRKQMALNARTAATTNPEMSPPGPGMRRTSSISQQPSSLEDRDMTKGNSLDSAVTWCRDLMWLLQRKLEQESVLLEALAEAGIPVPFEVPEAESRMAAELSIAMEHNSESNFQYSRPDGSGLYVPNYTDHGGRQLQQDFQSNFQHNGFRDTYQQAVATPAYSNPDSQSWMMSPALSGHNNDSLDYIEEDDKFDMDMH